jgi:hypothetical protein
MGHKDTRMLMQTYGHLIANKDFMGEAAKKAIKRKKAKGAGA